MLAACSFGEPLAEVQNLCRNDDECGGDICEEARCVARPADPVELVLRVVPTEFGDVRPPWTTEPFAVNGPTERDLDVPGWIEVRGQVRYEGERVDAELVFSRPGLPGRPDIVVRTTTLSEPVRDEDGEGEADYIVHLEAGQRYDVEIRPTASANADDEPWFRRLPPLRIVDQLETPAAVDGVRSAIWRAMFPYDPSFHEPCQPGREVGCTLEGSVVRMVEDVAMPEAGLQVRAIDESGAIVSSTSLTSEDGSYSIVISPGAGPYLLRVGGGSERPLFSHGRYGSRSTWRGFPHSSSRSTCDRLRRHGRRYGGRNHWRDPRFFFAGRWR